MTCDNAVAATERTFTARESMRSPSGSVLDIGGVMSIAVVERFLFRNVCCDVCCDERGDWGGKYDIFFRRMGSGCEVP